MRSHACSSAPNYFRLKRHALCILWTTLPPPAEHTRDTRRCLGGTLLDLFVVSTPFPSPIFTVSPSNRPALFNFTRLGTHSNALLCAPVHWAHATCIALPSVHGCSRAVRDFGHYMCSFHALTAILRLFLAKLLFIHYALLLSGLFIQRFAMPWWPIVIITGFPNIHTPCPYRPDHYGIGDDFQTC